MPVTNPYPTRMLRCTSAPDNARCFVGEDLRQLRISYYGRPNHMKHL